MEMALFFQILVTVFVAEMGDKTQLMMIAMTSRYKLRDIILGSGAAILVLNAIAVGFGAIVSSLIPDYVIKIVAALAFFYFAWSSLGGDDDEEEEAGGKEHSLPMLAVFGTFFLAELGDKTQLTAIAFGASHGVSHAILVWLACSVGLFAADVIGMLIGYLLKSKTPDSFFNTLAFVIFTIFGITTMAEGGGMLFGDAAAKWVLVAAVSAVFAVACIWSWLKKTKAE